MSVCCNNHNDNPSHKHTIIQEIIHHAPYAIFAVSFSLVLLSMMGYGVVDTSQLDTLYDTFHSLHFLHMVFAATGAVLAFRRHSRNLLGTILIGFVVPAIFCSLSDVVLPYFGGMMFGYTMAFHLCIVDHFYSVLMFLGIGVINGVLVSESKEAHDVFSTLFVHFLHIFISAFASTIYLISQGFYDWSFHMGAVFVYMIIAVIAPCTIADVIVPTWFGLWAKKQQKVSQE